MKYIYKILRRFFPIKPYDPYANASKKEVAFYKNMEKGAFIRRKVMSRLWHFNWDGGSKRNEKLWDAHADAWNDLFKIQ